MKNKYNIQRIIGGGIFAIGIIFIVIAIICFNKIGASTATVFFTIGLPFLVVGAIWYCFATSNSRKICDVCGESMEGCAYSYQEKNRKILESGRRANIDVFIDAKCPHCGANKRFTKKFYVNENSDNIQYQVDEFCRNHFGH